MKKNRIILIVSLIVIVIIGFIIGYNSASNEGVLSLTCDSDTIKVGDEVICTLKGNVSEYEVSAFSSDLDISGTDLKLEEVDVDSIWEGDGEEGDIDLYTDVDKSGKFNILTFTVSLEDTKDDKVEIRLKGNIYFDEDYQERKLEDINKVLKVRR